MIAVTQPHFDSAGLENLTAMLHRRVVDAVDPARLSQLPQSELHRKVRALTAHLCTADCPELPNEIRDRITGEVLDEIFGLGPLEALLRDPGVNSILINGPEHVCAERNGSLHATDVRFTNEAHLLRIIHRLVGMADRRIDERSPMVDGILPDGWRFSAVIPPLAKRGPAVSLRRTAARRPRLEEMERAGGLTAEMSAFLGAVIQGHLSLLICGSSGAGATAVLGALARTIPPEERLIAVERSGSTPLEHPGVVSLIGRESREEGTDEASTRQLFQSAIKMRPDRIIVAELQGSETVELVQACNSGRTSVMATIHASDPRDALARIDTLVARSAPEMPEASRRAEIASAIRILIQVVRTEQGEQRISKISELCGWSDGESELEEIFVYRNAGRDDNGRPLGAFYATGYKPASLSQLAASGVEIPVELFVPRELSTTAEAELKQSALSPSTIQTPASNVRR